MKVEVKPVAPSITVVLNMTEREAGFLRDIVGSVGGDPEGPSRVARLLYAGLDDVCADDVIRLRGELIAPDVWPDEEKKSVTA
jgi:hypothetical protein